MKATRHPYPGDPVVAQAIQAEIREVAGDGRRRK